MKIIFNYLVSVLYHEKNKIFPYIILFGVSSLISLMTIKNAYPPLFFYYWLGGGESFPIMIFLIKLLLMTTLFLAVEVFDIRRKNFAYLYFILARETKFNLKVNVTLTLLLTVLYSLFYGGILLIFQEQLHNVGNLIYYVLAEYIGFVTLLCIVCLFNVEFSSVFVVVIALINQYLPIKLPIGINFLNFDNLYPLPTYIVVLIASILMMFILEKRKWGNGNAYFE